MEKILLIDDEPDIISTLKGFLELREYSVVTASDGEEGMKKFESENPAVVICDIRMPNKDGFQFLKEIREKKAWVPIIILSALSDPASVLKGHSLEADQYLAKPMDLEKVLKSIQFMISITPLRRR
jgi:two-component system, OmpR family, alkaline phosphatase synthesis response regulator PhoP